MGLVGASFELLFHGEQPVLAVFPETLYTHAIHATASGMSHFSSVGPQLLRLEPSDATPDDANARGWTPVYFLNHRAK